MRSQRERRKEKAGERKNVEQQRKSKIAVRKKIFLKRSVKENTSFDGLKCEQAY